MTDKKYMNIKEAIAKMKNGKTVAIEDNICGYQFYYHKATKCIVLDCSKEDTHCPHTHYNGEDLFIISCDDFEEKWGDHKFILI